jgi:multiple sugar transport system substrate-binding protein
MQNVGIWSIKEMATNAPDVPYGIFRLPIPDGGRYVTVGGGWAFVANSRGRNPEAAARFIAWSIASMSQDSVQRMVTWNTVADSDMPPRNSVLAAGGDTFQSGNVGKFSREIHPGTRAEPRMPPQVYKIISDAIQAAMLAGKDPAETAESASRQLDAYLLHYRGASII